MVKQRVHHKTLVPVIRNLIIAMLMWWKMMIENKNTLISINLVNEVMGIKLELLYLHVQQVSTVLTNPFTCAFNIHIYRKEGIQFAWANNGKPVESLHRLKVCAHQDVSLHSLRLLLLSYVAYS